MHDAATKMGIGPLLDISSKSQDPLGKALSAFNIEVELWSGRHVRLEVAYQASKVFERGGPFRDLLALEPKQARRDPRLRSSGQLLGFDLEGVPFPSFPVRAFYDWLFVRTLADRPEIVSRLRAFSGFTDIEFSPKRSVNSQAHAIAAVVALDVRGWLRRAARSFDGFSLLLEEDIGNEQVERTNGVSLDRLSFE